MLFFTKALGIFSLSTRLNLLQTSCPKLKKEILLQTLYQKIVMKIVKIGKIVIKRIIEMWFFVSFQIRFGSKLDMYGPLKIYLKKPETRNKQ